MSDDRIDPPADEPEQSDSNQSENDMRLYTVKGVVKVLGNTGDVSFDVGASSDEEALAEAEKELRKSLELLDDTPIEWVEGPHIIPPAAPAADDAEQVVAKVVKQGSNVEYHITGTLTNKSGELHEIDITLDAPNEVEAILLIEADHDQPTWITGPMVISVEAEKSARTAKEPDITELLGMNNRQIAVLQSALYRIEHQREEVWKTHTKALAKAREAALEFKELTSYITELKAMIPGKPAQKRMF